MQMEKGQYNEREKTLREYWDPYRPNIGLNPDFKQEKKIHVQPDETDLAAEPHMNNNIKHG